MTSTEHNLTKRTEPTEPTSNGQSGNGQSGNGRSSSLVRFRSAIARNMTSLISTSDVAHLVRDIPQFVDKLEDALYARVLKLAASESNKTDAHRMRMYVDRIRCVWANLVTPGGIIQTIAESSSRCNGSSTEKPEKPVTTQHVDEIANMNPFDMNPGHWSGLIAAEKLADESGAVKLEATTDTFACPKCLSHNCYHFEMQTRSADEPMTTFLTCLDCDTRWKE
jgi:DNA-directed RNA polymerase subunit M/transcription elongation factor TFIIS